MRRRLFREFTLALSVLGVVGLGAWIFAVERKHRRPRYEEALLPPQVQALVGKRHHTRSEIGELAVAFDKLAEDAGVGIGKGGIAKAAIAADFKERWTALEAARLTIESGIAADDRVLMGRLQQSSLKLSTFLDSFSGWKPDEIGARLMEARTGFAKVVRDAVAR